jgi:hypothetical protein
MLKRSVLQRSWPKLLQPGVGAFDRPPEPHELMLLARLGSTLALPGDDGVVDVPLHQAGAGESGVVAPVEPQGIDILKQSALGDVVQSRCEQHRTVAAGHLEDSADRPFIGVGGADFQPVLPPSVRFGPVPSPPMGALCNDPSTETSERSRPMNLSKEQIASSTRAERTRCHPFIAPAPGKGWSRSLSRVFRPRPRNTP